MSLKTIVRVRNLNSNNTECQKSISLFILGMEIIINLMQTFLEESTAIKWCSCTNLYHVIICIPYVTRYKVAVLAALPSPSSQIFSEMYIQNWPWLQSIVILSQLTNTRINLLNWIIYNVYSWFKHLLISYSIQRLCDQF